MPKAILASKMDDKMHYSTVKSVFIYALRCPVTNDIRYVGKAANPAKRLADHLCAKEKDHRGNWVRSVLATGEKPKLEIIDEVPELEWPMWEVAYIQFFRDEGCNLVNATCGGEGVEMTLETRAKMRAAKLGKKFSPEHCASMSVALLGEKNHNFGKPKSLETRAKLSVAHSGKRLSSETKAKLSVVNLGKKLSSETKAKISAARLGKKLAPESKAKVSAARKAYWERMKSNAKIS